MQYQPGSWYLPWGIPVQKMLTMPPYVQSGSPNTTNIHQYAGTSNAPLNCHMLSTQHQGNANTNVSTPIQVQATTGTPSYQHPNFHPSAVGTFACTNAVGSLHRNSSGVPVQHATAPMAAPALLNNHTHGLLQNSQLPSNHSQHQNALLSSTMFSPLTIRSYLASSAVAAINNPLAGMSTTQPSLSDCAQLISQQSNQATSSTLTCVPTSSSPQTHHQTIPTSINLNVDVVAMRHHVNNINATNNLPISLTKLLPNIDQNKEKKKCLALEKRKAEDSEQLRDLKKAKLETKALKAKRPGFTDERYHETSYYIENGLRKVYPYYFTFTTFTKGRWVGEKILDVFAREFRAHPAEEYERCIKSGTLTVNYDKVPTDYRLKHNDLLANIVHRHEVPVTSEPISIVHMDDDIVVVNKPASIPADAVIDSWAKSNELNLNPSKSNCVILDKQSVILPEADPVNFSDSAIDIVCNARNLGVIFMAANCSQVAKEVHPCGRYRHNTVVFILAKEYNLKNLRTIHRLDRLTSGLLLFGRSPKKARQLEHQIRNRQVQKEYICRVEGSFPEGIIECTEPIEVVSYKIGVCKVSPKGKDCTTTFQKLSYNGETSVVLCKPLTGRMHQIRVHLQYLGFPVANDPLYNHEVFGPLKGRGGDIGGKSDDDLVRDLINIHNAENWLGIDSDSDISMFKSIKADCDMDSLGNTINDEGTDVISRETSPVCSSSPPAVDTLHDFSPVDISYTLENLPNDTQETNRSDEISTSPEVKVTVATQTGHESPDMAFSAEKMTLDKHCYECKVRYRDPKPKDLVMYLHAWKYKGPGWEYETPLPNWGNIDWDETK